ncbi:hypothetical protein NDU88_000397 [Pleurodeles waltl]|uniref:Uncharacterized protein n=1 Tax=Pleurodeles waltl TaxID=8319 RepID=A0AAV7U662_PLEWA|nr:hypothetical protein NDU88_000397 [Pleurodeles waltl]
MPHARSDTCPGCERPGADFLHLACDCCAARVFWNRVVGELGWVTSLLVVATPQSCLLANIKKPKERKVTYTFLHFALVLARPSVTISWMGQHAPELAHCRRDVVVWSLVEGTYDTN